MVSSTNRRQSSDLQHDSVGSPVMEYANTSRQYSHDFSFANSQDSSTGYPYPPSVSCEPGPGGYSSIRFSGYSGASGQEGRRHSVDAYGTGDSFSNRSSSSRNSSLLRHLSSGRSNVSLSF